MQIAMAAALVVQHLAQWGRFSFVTPLMWINVRSSVIHLVVCSRLVGHDVRMYVRMCEMCMMYGTSVMSVMLVCLLCM